MQLHILKAGRRLDAFEAQIESAFEDGIARIKEKLSLPEVDVVVADNPGEAIPETGVGGFAPTAHLVYISIDPTSADLKERIEQELKSTLAHELHHCARSQAIGSEKTLLEAVISEGLADHFDMSVNGGEPRPWSVAVQGERLRKIGEKAKAIFGDTKYDHTAWFFGSEKEEIPRWAGYSLGFKLVKDYMEKTGKSAAELVREGARAFI